MVCHLLQGIYIYTICNLWYAHSHLKNKKIYFCTKWNFLAYMRRGLDIHGYPRSCRSFDYCKGCFSSSNLNVIYFLMKYVEFQFPDEASFWRHVFTWEKREKASLNCIIKYHICKWTETKYETLQQLIQIIFLVAC